MAGMDDEQPRYFTLIDLMFELIHVGFVAVGCFVGWKLGGHFGALFAGGVVGRVAGLFLHRSLWLWADRTGRPG
jgi:hypothetical protein